MSTIISHKQCPACAKLGKDNGRNNLGVYTDGHHFCFSCGYYSNGDKTSNYSKRHANIQRPVQPERTEIRLPFDCDTRIPGKPREWLYQYEFTDNTITKHLIMWAESRQFLIFPYFISGILVGWQGRYFGTEKIGKWHTKGNVTDFTYTIGKPNKTLVLVEDIVSAIKVSRHLHSSPIFGSVISMSKFNTLRRFYKQIIIWLDPDKKKEAIHFANKGRIFGLNCQVILSEKDPKEHTFDEIESYLNDSTRSSVTEDTP